ncbi:MAG: M20/M25/M40 family metallo-hydrolase [Ignavibacteriales bacterium]|nr:M20/M25/M40 family metallo-hydrolase [Ignavibacteriales bacterium]
MMKRILGIVVLIAVFVSFGLAQMVAEKVDTVMINKIKEEGLKNSQVMNLLSTLSDIYGPRLAGSPDYKEAAAWMSQKLTSIGMQNVHFETSAPLAKGWALKKFYVNAIQPKVFPITAYPKAWSPGIKGSVAADVVFLSAMNDEELNTYKGKLKGKYVLVSPLQTVNAHFEPEGRRLTDTELLRLANAGPQGGGRGGQFGGNRAARDSMMRVQIRQSNPDADEATITRLLAERSRLFDQSMRDKTLEFCQKEGAIAALDVSRPGDGGTVFVAGAIVPQPAAAQQAAGAQQPIRINAYDVNAPQIVPQVVVAVEQYDRMVRMIQKGQKVRLEMALDVAWTPADSSFNIIAEIPGTDLKDQVVMLGGHFDSWHGGTGASDDGTGVAAVVEAVRILKALNLQPRRTIRIGLWAAEEEGLIGSRSYVTQHFGEMVGGGGGMGGMFGGGGELKKQPDYEKLSVYFNHDNGSGKFRGIYLQGNEAARPVFRAWLAPFVSMGASTITAQNTGGTDHQSFDRVGLPGFQFVQDPLEYDTRVHHSTADVFERVQADDMKQAATIMAAFAYQAAMRDEMFPRKPLPAPRPQRAPGSN